MNDVNFVWIGWCLQDSHDKVWAWFTLNGEAFAAWGRRGGKLRFKKHGKEIQFHVTQKLRKLRDKKEDEGYNTVDQSTLLRLFPDFEEKVSEDLLMDILAGNVK